MILLKESSKVYRSDFEVYEGYGFKILDNIDGKILTQYGITGERVLAINQCLAEALIVFKNEFLREEQTFEKENYFYRRLASDGKEASYLEYYPSELIKGNLEFLPEMACYKVHLADNNISIAAYDEKGILYEGEKLDIYHRFMLALMAFIGTEMLMNKDFAAAMKDFATTPVKGNFVYAYALFSLKHKKDSNIEISYKDMGYLRLDSSWEKIMPKKHEAEEKPVIEKPVPVNTEFSERLMQYMPKLSSELVLPTKLEKIAQAVLKGDVLTLLLHGPAGTGKTSACKLIGKAIGFPVISINCTDALDEFVLGKFIPQGDQIVFAESDITLAIREGGIVVFEEINFAKPQYLAFLNSLLDENAFVRLDNNQIVKRHKNFRFFATMNLGYFGTKELNQALYNRFNCIAELPALEDASISKMLTARVPECKPFVKKMLAIYNKIRMMIEQNELDIVISPRNLENWARLAKYQGYVEAAETTIIPVAKQDEKLEENIRDLIYTLKWD